MVKKNKTFEFDSPKIYDKIKIEDDNLIRVKNIKDSDGDTWTRVPYFYTRYCI